MGNKESRTHSSSVEDKRTRLSSQYHWEGSKLVALLDFIKTINRETSPQKASLLIVDSLCKLLGAERATIFLVDELTNDLVLQVTGQPVDIRVPMGHGIVGNVASRNEPMNISDAYDCDLFNSEVDRQTGFRTKSVLAIPVKDASEKVVAVVEVINKIEGSDVVEFSKEDLYLAEQLAEQAGVTLRNAVLFEAQRIAQRKVNAMLDIVRSLYSDLGINSLMFTITERTPQLVDANRCTLYLYDQAHHELWSMQGAVEIRIPSTSGIAGYVATQGELLNIHDAYEDSRFNQEFDKKSGYRTKSLLSMPIVGQSKVIGVLQLINKQSSPFVFTPEDEELLTTFLNMAGNVLETSQLFQSHTSSTQTEFERATNVTSHKGHKREIGSQGSMGPGNSSAIMEAEEEEED